MVSLYARSIDTLPIMLQRFRSSYETLYPSGSDASTINEGIIMAGNVLTILPLLVLYFVGQRQFTQSIDKTGITGE
jgi:multiple sugar transport system permease protein